MDSVGTCLQVEGWLACLEQKCQYGQHRDYSDREESEWVHMAQPLPSLFSDIQQAQNTSWFIILSSRVGSPPLGSNLLFQIPQLFHIK